MVACASFVEWLARLARPPSHHNSTRFNWGEPTTIAISGCTETRDRREAVRWLKLFSVRVEWEWSRGLDWLVLERSSRSTVDVTSHTGHSLVHWSLGWDASTQVAAAPGSRCC